MNHHDPQSTGRSRLNGPSAGIVDWIIDSLYMRSGISVSTDSSIILVSHFRTFGLYSFYSAGRQQWILKDSLSIRDNHSTPLISSDGTIYITGGHSGKLYAISKEGKIKWELFVGTPMEQTGLNIGLDGTLYFVSTNNFTLYAVSPNGDLLWSYYYPGFSGYPGTSVTFSPDGKILYIPGRIPSLFAFDLESHSIKWSFGSSIMFGTQIVDSEGNVYFNAKSESYNEDKYAFYSLKPDGSIRWSYVHDNNMAYIPYGYSSGTIDKNGNTFFAFDTLYSIDYQGNLRWKRDIRGVSYSPLISDSEGNIFIVVSNEFRQLEFINRVAAYSTDGNIVWNINKDISEFSGYSGAITYDQKFLFPTFKSKSLICIK